jgi:tRNA-binding protein
MASGRHEAADVAELGLTLATEADGLAVGRPSRFVGRLMEPLLDGCLTVADAGLFRHLAALYAGHGIEVEPSAAAGPAGMEVLFADPAGWAFARERGAERAAHVVWATGGRLVPPAEHAAYRARAVRMAREKGRGDGAGGRYGDGAAFPWEFVRVDMRVGRILSAVPLAKACIPAYALTVDLGPLGVKKSSARITELYRAEELPGRLVVAVVNFPPRRIAGFLSEVLVLGVGDAAGRVALLRPDAEVPLGARIY